MKLIIFISQIFIKIFLLQQYDKSQREDENGFAKWSHSRGDASGEIQESHNKDVG